MMRLVIGVRPVRTAAVGLVAMAGLLCGPALEARQAVPQGAAVPELRTTVATQRILLVAGTSKVLDTDFDVRRLAVTNEDVAFVDIIAPREVLIQAQAPGTVSLILWGETRREHYDLVVDPATSQLEQALAVLFPGEDIRVTVNEGSVVLSGSVSNNDTMLRVGELARASAPDIEVINMLQLPGGTGSQQVMLQVRFAEVNRRAIQEAGLNLFTTRAGFTARSTTQQFPAPEFDDVEGDTGGLVFADYLNLFFLQRNEGIGGVLRALEQNGWFESLAEPNLIAYNGQEASFLSGGEFPVVFVTGTTGQQSIVFKEYGVRLRFTPTIAGDVIRLSVDPEVSTLDFGNGVTLGGIRVPALTTRRAHTVVELRDGQSFAIAGLLDTINQQDEAAIPVLSKIPLIGHLFRSRARREDQTELMVLITPRLVRPWNPDEVPPLPTIIRRPGGGGGSGGDELADLILGGAGLIDAPPASRATRGSAAGGR